MDKIDYESIDNFCSQNHVSSFNGHNMAVNCVKMFQNDDETFVSGGLDRLLCLHNIQFGSIVSSFVSHSRDVICAVDNNCDVDI